MWLLRIKLEERFDCRGKIAYYVREITLILNALKIYTLINAL